MRVWINFPEQDYSALVPGHWTAEQVQAMKAAVEVATAGAVLCHVDAYLTFGEDPKTPLAT